MEAKQKQALAKIEQQAREYSYSIIGAIERADDIDRKAGLKILEAQIEYLTEKFNEMFPG